MGESLSGKVALVTGGAKRVGAAIVRRLHREGASVMLHYRGSEREAKALRSELNAARANSVALVQADLLDLAGLAEIVRNAVVGGRLAELRVDNHTMGSDPHPRVGKSFVLCKSP